MLRRWITTVCICLTFSGHSIAMEREVDLELVLAADISDSMDLEEAALQRQGYVFAIRHPEVISAIQRGRLGRIAVTYVEWAGEGHQRTLVGWTEVADAAGASAFADTLEQSSVRIAAWTSISSAIISAARSFEGNGYHGEQRIIDISGDGPNNHGVFVDLARDRAVADGIVINGLPIINDRPNKYGYPLMPDLDLYYEDCVIGGPGAFFVVAQGFEDFARAILSKLVTEIAGRAPLENLRLIADRVRPPCSAGEIQLQNWRPDLYDF